MVGLLISYLLISVRMVARTLFQTDFFNVFVSAVGGGAWFLNFLNFNIAMALAGIMTAVLHLLNAMTIGVTRSGGEIFCIAFNICG